MSGWAGYRAIPDEKEHDPDAGLCWLRYMAGPSGATKKYMNMK